MRDIFMKHKKAFIGGFIGLLLAILMLAIGFWKAMLVLILTGVGVVIGMVLDGNPVIKFKSK